MNMTPDEVLSDFKSYSFFAGFPDDLLQKIAGIANRFLFKENDLIMEQGQKNDALIFLNAGAVDVLVDGERVAQLRNKGEVLGEMSVISHLPAAASIRACSPVIVYIIEIRDFDKIDPENKANNQVPLYKVFSTILSERLRITNEKARQNEISNRELQMAHQELQNLNSHLEDLVKQRTQQLEQKAAEIEASSAQLETQNAALVASFKKLSEKAELSSLTVDKIRSLENDMLPHLQSSLNDIFSAITNKDQQKVLESASHEVQQIIGQLHALGVIHQNERGLENRRVLLIEGEKKQQLVAKMALGGTGVALDIAGDDVGAKDFLTKQNYDLVIGDINLDTTLQWAHDYKPDLPIAVMTSDHIENDLQKLQGLPFVSHVVSRDITDRSLTVKTIVTTINKILTQDFMGVEKYLSWGVDVHEVSIRNSGERADRIAEMQEIFKKIGVRGSLLDRCGIVAEEMLMNAIYDAPCDKKGSPLFNHLPRTETIELSKEQASKFRYACDGNMLAVSVVDPFGTLKKKIIFDYLETCYQGKAGILNDKKGGAGRGLHQIIENSDTTVFNVHSRRSTEVICLLHTDSNRKSEDHNPGVQYFFY